MGGGEFREIYQCELRIITIIVETPWLLYALVIYYKQFADLDLHVYVFVSILVVKHFVLSFGLCV